MTLNQPPFSGRNKLERNRENPAAENEYERKAGTTVWDRSPIPSPSSFSHFLVFSLCRGSVLPSAHLPIHPRIFCMGCAEGIEVALLPYQYLLSWGYGICGTYCRKGEECSIDWIRKLTKPQEREQMLHAARAITWSNRPANATKKKQDTAGSENPFLTVVEINQRY